MNCYSSRDDIGFKDIQARGGVFRQFRLCSTRKNMATFFNGEFYGFLLFMYDIQHCFICRPSDSTVPEDAEIEPRTVVTRYGIGCQVSNHSPGSHPLSARSHPHMATLMTFSTLTYPRKPFALCACFWVQLLVYSFPCFSPCLCCPLVPFFLMI